jgi:hypothetical protein
MIRPHAAQSLLGSPRLWPRLDGVLMKASAATNGSPHRIRIDTETTQD